MRLDAFIGPGTRFDGDRLPPLRVDRQRRGQADRRLRLRAARHAAIHRHASAPTARRAKPKWRTSTSAWCRGKAIARRLRPWPKCSSCVRTSNGAAWDSSRNPRLRLRDSYADWDAEQRFDVPGVRVTDPKAAQCGEVLKGVLKPRAVQTVRQGMYAEHPIGALMVSSEGSCAAYYNYEHRKAAMATSLTSIGVTAWRCSTPGPLQDPLSRSADRDGSRSRRQGQPQAGRRPVCAAAFRVHRRAPWATPRTSTSMEHASRSRPTASWSSRSTFPEVPSASWR